MNILSLKLSFYSFFVQGNEFFSIRCLILTLESPLLAGKSVGGLVKQRKLVSFVRVSVSLRCPVNGSKVVFQTYCFFLDIAIRTRLDWEVKTNSIITLFNHYDSKVNFSLGNLTVYAMQIKGSLYCHKKTTFGS